MALAQTMVPDEGFPSDFVFVGDLKIKNYPDQFMINELKELTGTKIGLFEDTLNKRACVIKRLNKLVFGKKELDNFQKMLEEMKGISKRFIVQYYTILQTPEYTYLVMEYLPLGNLKQLIGKKKGIPENTAKFYVACIILALESLHLKSIVHNDININNVVLDENGYAKLVDFDSAKVVPTLHPHLFTDLTGLATTTQDLLIGQTLEFVDLKSIGKLVSKEARSVLFMLTKSSKSYNKLNCRMCLANVSDSDLFKDFNWLSLREGTMQAPVIESPRKGSSITSNKSLK